MRTDDRDRTSVGDGPAATSGTTDGAPAGSRSVELSRDRSLVVRPVGPSDVEGLAALYGRLDDRSRYRRFFSIWAPDDAFFERLVHPARGGGAGLVAVARSEGLDEIVAEAGYVLLPNGDGEFAMVVDHAWRGWLGAYLLDALVEVAASNGVPNLEADILQMNRPMLALVRSRGYATVPSDDFTVVRTVIGAAAPMPTWPGSHDRPRILVEGPGGHWHDRDATDAAGFDVLACPGPTVLARRCPALAGRPCPLAAGADTIVVSQLSDDDRWKTLRSAHARLHPAVPVCVELSRRRGSPAASERVIRSSDDALAVVGRVAAAGCGRRRRVQGRTGPGAPLDPAT